MKDLNEAAKGSVVGEIVKIDEVPEVLRVQLNADATVVTVQDFEGQNHAIWFSDNQISEFGLKHILFIGNVVSVDVEYRIEGETEYLDASGNVQFHEATNIGAVNASHASMIILRTKGLDSSFCDALAKTRAEHDAKPAQRNLNLKSLVMPANVDGLPVLIADLERKRDKATSTVYKQQYDQEINRLKGMLKKADDAKQEEIPDEGGSAVGSKTKRK